MKAETLLKLTLCHSSPDARSGRERPEEQGAWSEEQMAKGRHSEDARGKLPGFEGSGLICQRSIQLQKGVLSENDSLRGC